MPQARSVEIRLLGPVELRVDGQDVSLGGARQRALLGLLGSRPRRSIPTDELIEELWAGEPTDGAETTLRSYVSRLRASLHGAAAIQRTDGGYALDVADEAVDLAQFERLVSEGGVRLAAGAARPARDRLGSALALWRDRPFGEVGSDGELGRTAQRLEELRLLALELRLEADLALGAAAEIVDELEALVRRHPYRERLWRHLMLALYRAGRQADALAAYHRARETLDRDLGIEPGVELRELEGAILRQAVPEVARLERGSNLPVALTSFVGRTTEIAEVASLVTRHRLVTLSGIGGVGKTRLALEVARHVGDAFPDGTWFVDLAPLTDPELVPASLAAALGVRERGGGVAERLAAELAARELLLVLDNCEHLRDSTAELAASLLGLAPGVHILATSRVTLGTPGEVDYAVPPLALPRAAAEIADARASDAVRLFMERARAARPSLADDEATAEAAARIAADLEGLPLAIELAAARAKALTVPDIAANLQDRFQFLVSWRRLASARHRTLAEAMAWSFNLLDPPTRALLAGLSVFAGSFDLDAAATIVLDGDRTRALELMQRLVDASLTSLEAGRDGGSRYRLLETVREYAAERLVDAGSAAAAQARHARYYAEIAAAMPEQGSEVRRAYARLDLELDNVRAAIDRSGDLGDLALRRRLTTSLWRYWLVRGLLEEGRVRLDRTLADGPDVAPDDYAGALLGAGNIAWQQGRYEEGRRFASTLLDLAVTSGARALEYAANKLLASIALRERDFDGSNARSLRAIELARELGNPVNLAMSEMNHAVLLMDWGRTPEAVGMFEQTLARFEAAGHLEGVGLSLLNLGEAAYLLGRDDDARRHFEAARDAFGSIGFRAHLGHATQGLAAIAARTGDPATAAKLLGRATAILGEVGAARDDFNPGMVTEAETEARGALGDDVFQAAFDQGLAGESFPGD